MHIWHAAWRAVLLPSVPLLNIKLRVTGHPMTPTIPIYNSTGQVAICLEKFPLPYEQGQGQGQWWAEAKQGIPGILHSHTFHK